MGMELLDPELVPKLVTDNPSTEKMLSGGDKMLRLREILSPLEEDIRCRMV